MQKDYKTKKLCSSDYNHIAITQYTTYVET
jgi:hypothetical protein